MTIANPTDIELARADFIRHRNAETRECLNARRKAKAARGLVKRRLPLPYGPDLLRKITERSRLVYDPL